MRLEVMTADAGTDTGAHVVALGGVVDLPAAADKQVPAPVVWHWAQRGRADGLT